MDRDPVSKVLGRATPGQLLTCLMGYSILHAARATAEQRKLPGHAAAVPLLHLRSKWMTDSVILWMLYQDHVVHVQVPAVRLDHNGGGTVTESLVLTEFSAFALTDRGHAFASEFLASLLFGSQDDFNTAWDMLLAGGVLPSFDTDERILHWGAHVLKHFRQPAGNQTLILTALEELGWPAWTDDPLPRVSGTDSKERLHDTIKNLNRHQMPYLVHFKGDGTGTQIGWEYH
jgi:hypothetical protein